MYSVTESFVAWLNDRGYRASTYPPKTGDEFVTVEPVGGYVADMVDFPSIAIQTWAKTPTRAELMAKEIKLALLQGDLPYGIAHVEVNQGEYPFWDEDTRLPRYQLALDITAILTD